MAVPFLFMFSAVFGHHLEVIINSFFSHKFVVVALFNKTFVVEHDNCFGVSDGAQAVSNGENGSSFGKTFKALLDHSFAFVIKCGSGFVKNEHGRVLKENAGVVKTFLEEYEKSVMSASADAAATGALCEKYGIEYYKYVVPMPDSSQSDNLNSLI